MKRTKVKITVFTLARVLTGLYLGIHAVLTTFNYPRFLNRIDAYFENVRFFDSQIVYNVIPLIPFLEFGIGVFLAIGLYTNRILIGGFLLLFLIALFLLDAEIYSMTINHLVVAVVLLGLFFARKYNARSIDYKMNSHQLQ